MRYISAFLRAVGLQRWTRQTRHKLRARGLLRWQPLIPESDFFLCALNAINLLKDSNHRLGDYLEFGVSRGTSYACMHHALRHAGVKHARLIGFDSFEGFPKEAAHQGWEPGANASSLPATVRYLRKKGVPREAMNFVKGWYADTLTAQTKARLELNKVSLVMIDCDIYTASYEALCFCAPLIADKAVIFFDDWGWRADIGEIGQKEAFEEFLGDFPEFSARPLPSYLDQARVFLVTRLAHAQAMAALFGVFFAGCPA